MDLNSLGSISKSVGLGSVNMFLTAIGEKVTDLTTVRNWLKTRPRRIQLLAKGLLYEQIEGDEMIVVSQDKLDQVTTELEGLRQLISDLKSSSYTKERV